MNRNGDSLEGNHRGLFIGAIWPALAIVGLVALEVLLILRVGKPVEFPSVQHLALCPKRMADD